jgi:outer membrane protein insertion porin family
MLLRIKGAIENKAEVKKILPFTACYLLFTIYCLMFAGSVAASSIAGEIEIQGLYSMGKDELLYLLDIASGEIIDADRIRKGIKRAFLKGIFEDISVETTDGEKPKVVIRVRERDVIKNIDIKGDYDLSKKTIKELFLLKEGQDIRCDILDEAIRDIKTRLSTLGFPRASIKAEIERLKKPYRINIILIVYTGDPEKIKKIVVSGAGDEIRSLMKLSEGDIYNQVTLKKDIERIKAYYKGRQYYKPVIEPPSFSDGTLSILVNPGKRLSISTEGNENLSTKTLLKEMPFFEAEDFHDDIVEEAVQRLQTLYHSKGFTMAQAVPVVTSKDDYHSLNFFIYEGPRIETGKISFSGNSLNDESLKEIISLKEGRIYNPDLIDTDRETLQDFYIALGYLSADVEEFQTHYDKDSQEMDIMIRIHEGLRTEIEDINILGPKIVSDTEIRGIINLKKGDPYNDVDIYDARLRIIEFYNNKGFPDASVTVKTEIAGQKANITLRIDEGTLVLFGRAIVTGNQKTKYKVVKRELLQQEDTPFDYSILARERQKLYKLGLFTDVDIEILDRYDDRKDVLMKLREGNAGAVEFGLGYADYEKYRGFLDLSYRNLWGMNRQASTRFELSSLEKRLIVQYYEPWFMDKPLPFRAFLLTETKQELNVDTKETLYRLKRHTATAGFEKKFGEKIKSELYYEFSVVNTYDVQPDVVLSKEDTGTLVISGLRLGLVYDTRDNPFYPAKGVLSGMTVEFTSPVFFSETDFIKLTAYYNFYYAVMKNVVLAASLRGGGAQGYLDTDELPLVERFFLGGRTTVRGYNQDELGPKGSDGNPVGGNTFLMGNLEARISLSKSLGIVAFLDGGNVWRKINDINPKDIKFTTGPGLRYNTPVGPLRIDYGFKLQREKGESAGEVHFSIGHAF